MEKKAKKDQTLYLSHNSKHVETQTADVLCCKRLFFITLQIWDMGLPWQGDGVLSLVGLWVCSHTWVDGQWLHLKMTELHPHKAFLQKSTTKGSELISGRWSCGTRLQGRARALCVGLEQLATAVLWLGKYFSTDVGSKVWRVLVWTAPVEIDFCLSLLWVQIYTWNSKEKG